MIYPKFSDLQSELMDDLDLNEETFIQPSSFKSYYNDAVEFVQAKVHTLYEDYFKTVKKIDVTEGESTLDLPTNIYANKIRKIFWRGLDEGDRYEILPIKDLSIIMFVRDSDRYRYDLLNDNTDDVALGVQLNVYPAFRETTTFKPIWFYYLRSANIYVNDNSVCDIPEFSKVINQYVTYRCRKKEGHPLTQLEKEDLSTMIDNMVETLRTRTPDENDVLLKDLSFYDDFDPFRVLY